MKKDLIISHIKTNVNGHNQTGIEIIYKDLEGKKYSEWLVDASTTHLNEEQLSEMVIVLNEHFMPNYKQKLTNLLTT